VHTLFHSPKLPSLRKPHFRFPNIRILSLCLTPIFSSLEPSMGS
jgi:hypothetical protein